MEIIMLLKNYHRQNKLIEENIFNKILEEILEKKNNDLLKLNKLKECISQRYDRIISNLIKIIKDLSNLRSQLKNKCMNLKRNISLEKYNPDEFLNIMQNMNYKLKSSDFSSFFPFFSKKGNNIFQFSFQIMNFKKLLENHHYICSPIQYLFFHNFNITLYPYGLNRKSQYMGLIFNFLSKIRRNYDFIIHFEIVNRDPEKAYKVTKKIKKKTKTKFYIPKLYVLKNLEKDGFIQDNGDFIMKYFLSFDESNKYLYDIDDYYKINNKETIKIKKESITDSEDNEKSKFLRRKRRFRRSLGTSSTSLNIKNEEE